MKIKIKVAPLHADMIGANPDDIKKRVDELYDFMLANRDRLPWNFSLIAAGDTVTYKGYTYEVIQRIWDLDGSILTYHFTLIDSRLKEAPK